MGREVPQKLWLQVATTSSTILSMQMKHYVLMGSPSKGLSWEEDRSLPRKGVISPSMPQQPRAQRQTKKRKRRRARKQNARKMVPIISILFPKVNCLRNIIRDFQENSNRYAQKDT